MRNIALLTILAAALLSMSSVALSQSSSVYTWSGWQSDPCFSGIQFRTRYSNYNDSAKKHEWRIQYKNNYAKKVAFSYVLGGSREAIAKYVNTYGAEYRGSIQPGQTSDPNMWTFTDSAAMLWEVIGHVRFLAPGQIDVGPTPYETCDSQGNRGMIDYICRNDPTPDFDCQNNVKPSPAAKPLPFSGGKKQANATAASAEECLKMYETFSANKNATALVTLNKAGEAAGEFRERCKLTPDQTVFIEKELSQIGIRMDAVKRQLLADVRGSFLVENTAKENVPQLKGTSLMVENLRKHLREGQFYADLNDGNLEYTENAEKVLVEASDDGVKLSMEIRHQSLTGSGWNFRSLFVWHLSWAKLKQLKTRKYGDNSVSSVEIYSDDRTCERKLLENHGFDPDNFTRVGCGFPYFLDSSEDYSSSFESLLTRPTKIAVPTDADASTDADDSALSNRQSPTTVTAYEKKILAEAKAAGKLPSTKPTATTKTSPPLTPKQRAARNAEAQTSLSELIQKDIAEDVSGTKKVIEEPAANRPVEPAKPVATESVFSDPSGSLGFTMELPSIATGKWLPPSITRSDSSRTFIYIHEDTAEMRRIELSAFKRGQSDISSVVKAARDSLESLARNGYVIYGEETFSLGPVSGTVLEWSDRSSRRRSYYFPNSNGGYYYVSMAGPADWVKAEGDKIIKSIRFK